MYHKNTNIEMLMLVCIVWSTVGCHRCAVEQRRPGSRRRVTLSSIEQQLAFVLGLGMRHFVAAIQQPRKRELLEAYECPDDRDRAVMRLRREEHPSGDVHELGHQSRLQLGDSNGRGTSVAGTVPRGCLRETEASPSTRRRTRSSVWTFV